VRAAEGKVLLWQVKDNEVDLRSVRESGPIGVTVTDFGNYTASWSPDGTFLLAQGAGGKVYLWAVKDGQANLAQPQTSAALGGGGLAWSPTGSYLTADDGQGKVQVWRVQDGAIDLSKPGISDALQPSWAPGATIRRTFFLFWSPDERFLS